MGGVRFATLERMFASQGSLPLAFGPSADRGRMRPDVPPSTPCDLSAISLYCGAGGLDLGFSRVGFEVRWAIDNDPFAVQTYNANLEPYACCGDVLEVDPPAGIQPDVVIGGPPCQGFSVIGRMNPGDHRSQHVGHFLDVVERLRPRAFVMENVKALAASPRWREVRDGLMERGLALGYGCELYLLNARDFGVPQSRERMFLIGIEGGGTPQGPEPTSAGKPPTVREALAALPRFGDPGNDLACAAKVIPARSPVMRPSAFNGSLLFNGSGRPLALDAPAKTIPASMGGNATPIIDQEELDSGAEPWVVGYHRHLQEGGAPIEHVPERLRRLTVQEAAALQTFPPEWRFSGSRVAQYRQIGNAVPPNLAEAVGISVRQALEHAEGESIVGREVAMAAA